MTTQNDAISIVLANRHYLYHLLQRIFGQEPNLELLEIVTGEQTREAIELIQDENENSFEVYFTLLGELKESLSTDVENTLDNLQSEYTYLLLGPNKLPAPPWESVYLTRERTIFQASTLNVRQTYLKYQFLPANYPHEADDHLALELDFMSLLAKMASEHFEENKVEEVKKVLYDQKTFLEEHLLVWIGEFALQIQSSKTHHFYPQMAKLTEQILNRDFLILDEIISLL